MSDFNYSVVVPVYNGEKTIGELMDAIHQFFATNHYSYEVIMVDDCSPDNSWQVMQQLKSKYAHSLKIIHLSKNVGQHNATNCGINFAKGKFVITLDDDLQTHPDEVNKLIAHQQSTHADLVYGVYTSKQHSWFRNVASKMVIWLFHQFSNTYSHTSSFRLINHELVQQFKHHHQKYFLLDEVMSWYTHQITHVYVNHHSSKKGASTYSIFKLTSMTLNYMINYTVIPLRIMTYGGLIFSFFNFCLVIYYLWDKFFNYVELGFTSLIVAVFFSTGLILFCLGIIGEYIARIYAKDNTKPAYFVKEKQL